MALEKQDDTDLEMEEQDGVLPYDDQKKDGIKLENEKQELGTRRRNKTTLRHEEKRQYAQLEKVYGEPFHQETGYHLKTKWLYTYF